MEKRVYKQVRKFVIERRMQAWVDLRKQLDNLQKHFCWENFKG